jgi:hypothetical protein
MADSNGNSAHGSDDTGKNGSLGHNTISIKANLASLLALQASNDQPFAKGNMVPNALMQRCRTNYP